MPAISHFDVQHQWVILMFAILMNATVAVGKVINIEMKAVLDVMSNRALAFPVQMTQLCHLAGLTSPVPTPQTASAYSPSSRNRCTPPKRKLRRGRN